MNRAPQKLEVHYRISIVTALMMVGSACIFWALQIFCSLTGVGELVSWGIGGAQDIFFLIWFFFAGINYFGKNSLSKLGVTLITDVIELIPLIDDFPASIVQVVTLIYLSRKEDRQKAEAAAAEAQKEAASAETINLENHRRALMEQAAENALRQNAASAGSRGSADESEQLSKAA